MDGWESCLRFTLYALKTEPSPRVRCHLVHELTTLATTLCASAGPLKALPAPLSDELCQLVVGPHAQEDSRLRHAVFALLQCLGQRPPTMHRALADRPLPPEGACVCVCVCVCVTWLPRGLPEFVLLVDGGVHPGDAGSPLLLTECVMVMMMVCGWQGSC